MWVMSDRSIPRSFRFMEGFGVHTFRFVDANDRSTFVKFHWKPKLGLQSVAWNEAVKINGRSEEHTSELQSLMRISYAVFCLKKKKRSHGRNKQRTKEKNSDIQKTNEMYIIDV